MGERPNESMFDIRKWKRIRHGFSPSMGLLRLNKFVAEEILSLVSHRWSNWILIPTMHNTYVYS